jgi:tRNA1(Val) A37 N6-methylase TrmN6
LNILHAAELLRIKANSQINPEVKSTLGQFFTPHSISLYMASLFNRIEGNISLLDPGCGSGSLTAAFVDESLRRSKISSINIHAFDVAPSIQPFIAETLSLCTEKAKKHGVSINANFILDDFIFNKTKNAGLFASRKSGYSHIIMNPPYKKIATNSDHRKALQSVGIETVNLYTGFVALALQQLARGGELVAIIPRSFCNGVYYQPFREFVLREIAIKHIHNNPDLPDRPVNSPKACYQITTELFDVLVKYSTDEWEIILADWLERRETLVAQYAKEREMEMIPLTLEDGTEIRLSPGNHSQLIRDIVIEFGPRFAPGAEVIYLGDTGAKEDFFRKDRLAELGVTVDRKGKLPDVVLYWSEKDWLLLIESVTSHGAVDSKRHSELSTLFASANPGLIYVTAFLDRRTMAKYLTDISWETEVWIADAPTHMIHFNGDKFLGPHQK